MPHHLGAGRVRYAAIVLAALGMLSSLAPIAHAQTSIWSGNGADENWTTGDNWAPAGAPVNDGTATLAMNGSVRNSSTIDAPYSISTMTFEAASPAMSVIAGVGAPTLTLTGANGLTNLSAVEQRVDIPLTLTGAQSWQTAAGGRLRVDGPITSVSGKLSKTGDGTLDLRGDNSGLADGLSILGGAVEADGPLRVGALSSELLLNGGGLRLSGAGDWTTRTGAQAMGTAGATIDTSGFDVTMNGWQGPGFLSGTRTFTKAGAGTLTLATSSNFNSGYILDVAQGTLKLQGGLVSSSGQGVPIMTVATGAKVEAAGQSLHLAVLSGGGDITGIGGDGLRLVTSLNGLPSATFSGQLSGTGGLEYALNTTHTLSGDNSQLSGGLRMSRGTLVVNSEAALGAPSGGLDFSLAFEATLRFGSSFTMSPTRAISLPAFSTGSVTLDTSGHDVTISQGFVAGAGGLSKAGAGTLTIGGNNAGVSTRTSISGGTLRIATFANLPGGALTIEGSDRVLQVTGPSSESTHAILLGPSNSSGSGVIDVTQANSIATLNGSISRGKLVKEGAGTLVLAGANSYTGGTQVKAGRLTGSLQSIRGALEASAGATIAFTDGFAGLVNGSIVGAGTIELDAPGPWKLAGSTSAFAGTVRLKQGSLTIDAPVGSAGGALVLGAGTSATVSQSIDWAVRGDADATLTMAGNAALGDPASFSGFNFGGELAVGSSDVTLFSAGLAGLGRLTTIDQGAIRAVNGVTLGNAEVLQGAGRVDGRVAGDVGSTIAATGNLQLGDAGGAAGFQTAGDLYVGPHTVTLDDKNEAVLGSLTTLDGGSLQARDGAAASDAHAHFLLGPGNNLTGRGTIAGNFKNNGNVVGDGTAMGERVVFAAPWKVTGKGTFENTLVLGPFAPGESPGVVDGKNMAFGGTIELELGGLTPGAGPHHHDQVNDLGAITLVDAVDLKILPYEGFLPTIGDTFEVLTWQASLVGEMGDLLVDPWFAAQGIGFDLLVDNTEGPGSLSLLARAAAWTPGDFNRDGRVDGDDLTKWRADFGGGAGSDANGDGDSDGVDFLSWQQHLSSATAASAAVPEPAGLVLALASLGGMIARRRRALRAERQI